MAGLWFLVISKDKAKMDFIKRLFKSTQPLSDSTKNGGVAKEDREVKESLDGIGQNIIDFYIDAFAREDMKSELLIELDNFKYFDEYFNTTGFVDLSNRDPLFEDAARLIVIQQQGLTSLIQLMQRKFAIGYNRAKRLMDQLEAAGIVGAFEGNSEHQIPDTINTLSLEYEIILCELNFDKVRSKSDFEETIGVHEDISKVVDNHKDLIKPIVKLFPIAVIKA